MAETPVTDSVIGPPLITRLPYPDDPSELFSHFAAEAGSIFLDSALTDNRLGRWSFITADPRLVLKTKGDSIRLIRGTQIEHHQGNPFDFLTELLKRFTPSDVQGLPPFFGGAAGYFSYDLAHFVEDLPRRAVDDLHVPDMWVGLYDWCVALDHTDRSAQLICQPWRPDELESHPDMAEERHKWVKARLSSLLPSFEPFCMTSGLKSNFSKERYMQMVEQVREYIAAGDIFQANVSQRFEAGVEGSPWDLYRRLRCINPAPFAAYLNLGDLVVASASPERFLQVRHGTVETRPIKGTSPRGATKEEDEASAQTLAQSTKDRAENVMIVDLLRNDIGRVCEIGSVSVPELVELEVYATVFHLVSTVTGNLASGKDAVDLLRACWPGGSITGAPKVRAMEIIDELEPTTRGIYCGSIGYINLAGDMDTSIVIRTIVIKDGRAYFQVGGGITTCSDPEMEYQETLDKGRALVRAMEGEK